MFCAKLSPYFDHIINLNAFTFMLLTGVKNAVVTDNY